MYLVDLVWGEREIRKEREEILNMWVISMDRMIVFPKIPMLNP